MGRPRKVVKKDAEASPSQNKALTLTQIQTDYITEVRITL